MKRKNWLELIELAEKLILNWNNLRIKKNDLVTDFFKNFPIWIVKTNKLLIEKKNLIWNLDIDSTWMNLTKNWLNVEKKLLIEKKI